MGGVLCLTAILSQEDSEFLKDQHDEHWFTIGLDDDGVGTC